MRRATVAVACVIALLSGCGGDDLGDGGGTSTSTAPAGSLAPDEAMAQYCGAVEDYVAAAVENPDDPAVVQQGQEVTAQGQALAEQAAVDPGGVDLAELQECQRPLTQIAPPPEPTS